jgi:adenine-specific DNA-methyltransferase
VDDVTILHGDCIERMSEIPDGSVSLIVTDPPYFRVKDEAWDRQWKDRESFLAWIGELCEEWQRVLSPNGSLYVFASPEMAARVECKIGERFEVINRITWRKPPFSTKAEMFRKGDLRSFFPASEAIIFAEHFGADNHAKGEAGYAAKCDELRGFLFEPIRAYLEGECDRAKSEMGFTRRELNLALGCTETSGGMLKHYTRAVQWCLPTPEHYETMRRVLNAAGGNYLRREYDDLRREYDDLRREYDDLRRPFSVSTDVPYTDVWDFPTVQDHPGKHPCEKPLAMIEHIVRASSRPGELVLDCFAGSGVTGQACRNLGRRCILIEKDPYWAKMARIWMDRPHAYVPREKVKPLKPAETPLFQGF